jgi:hypothetical protein
MDMRVFKNCVDLKGMSDQCQIYVEAKQAAA